MYRILNVISTIISTEQTLKWKVLGDALSLKMITSQDDDDVNDDNCTFMLIFKYLYVQLTFMFNYLYESVCVCICLYALFQLV